VGTWSIRDRLPILDDVDSFEVWSEGKGRNHPALDAVSAYSSINLPVPPIGLNRLFPGATGPLSGGAPTETDPELARCRDRNLSISRLETLRSAGMRAIRDSKLFLDRIESFRDWSDRVEAESGANAPALESVAAYVDMGPPARARSISRLFPARSPSRAGGMLSCGMKS
jgi:hypothetical protein